MFNPAEFADLYPFAPHHHTTPSGAQMHYLDEGASNAPHTILCLHGNPTWSFYYREIAHNLSLVARVIVPDHIGCGLSDKPADTAYNYTLRNRVEDVESLIKSLNIHGNITLVLHDWGGMIGMAFAHRNPSLISNIFLLNTGAFPLPTRKPMPWQLRLARTCLGPLLIQGFNAFACGTANLGTCKPLPPKVRKGLLAPYDSWNNRIATHRFVKDIPLSPADKAWKIVAETADNLHQWRNTHVEIFWGKHDPVFDDHFLAQWQEYLPNATVHYYEDASHYVLEEKAYDIITAIKTALQ